MKRKWERPQTMVQKFEANEYVAACVTGTIQCAYPGNGQTNGQMEYNDYCGTSEGWWTEPGTGLQHGVCGYDATINFDSETATGYEVENGKPNTSRVIWGIEGYDLEEGTYTVTWLSRHNPDPNIYHHKGRLIITNIDNDHPNRS